MRKFTLLLAFLAFVGLSGVYAQQKTITGKVTSAEDGSILPGATVVVKGTAIGTTSANDGTYRIVVPDKYTTLVFSFMGMKTQEKELSGSTLLNVVLEPDILNLDEVVVTAIGITKESKALGYAVQNVGAEVLEKAATPNIVNSLNGRVAGLQVINSAGTAGGSSFITLRGAASITGNNQPLFVIDGVPIDNGGGEGSVDGVALSNRVIDLNPDDIASVSILKGGAATALYGLRAASGAIIITTKKGSMAGGKKIVVSYNASYTTDIVNKLPELQTAYAQGMNGAWSSGHSRTWGPRIDSCYYTKDPSLWLWPDYDLDGAIVGKSNPLANSSLGAVKTYDPYDFFQKGHGINNSVSIAGGNLDANFYLSFSNLNSTGVVPNNTFVKNTFKISGESKVNERLKISGSANYLNDVGNRIQQGSNVSGVMLGLLRTPATFNNAGGYELLDGTQRTYRHGGGYDNPYWTANKNLYKDDVDRMIGHIQLDYRIFDWMTVTYRLGSDWYNRNVKDYIAINSRVAPAGRVYVDQYLSKDINSDLLFNIKKDITKDIQFNAVVGHNMAQLYGFQLWSQADGLDLPGYYNLSNSASLTTGESTSKIRRAAFFGDFGISYKSMLYANVTGRNDWSTTLPAGNNSFFYPSVSAGFVFTEIESMKKFEKILPYGKARVSYAIVAKDAEAYNTATPFAQATAGDGWTNGIAFPFLGYTGFSLSDGKGNTGLMPEKTKTFEAGLDLRFAKNRLGVDLTYYNSKGQDLLLPVSIAASSGYASLYLNAAKMTNNGFEVAINAIPVKTEKFKWSIDVNWTKISNTVDELAPNVDNLFLGGFTDPQIRAVAGEPYRSIYGYDWLRDDKGNVLIDTATGFPLGDYSNMKSIGKVDPDWTSGINNTFTYKGVSFSFLWDIKKGGLMWNGTRGALANFGTSKETETREATDLYTFKGVQAYWDTLGNLVPIAGSLANTKEVVRDVNWYYYGEGSGFTGPTYDFIENSGWVRLREVNLSYKFSPKCLKSTFIKDLELYFTGRNLLLFTDYTGIDPETNLYGASNAQGMDYFNMPGTKSYTFGLKAGF